MNINMEYYKIFYWQRKGLYQSGKAVRLPAGGESVNKASGREPRHQAVYKGSQRVS